MQRPPRRFKEFFLGTNRPSSRGQVPYHPERMFRGIGQAAVAGVYQGKFEPTHRVRRDTTLGQLQRMAGRAHQESIYGVSAGGHAYLVEPKGYTRFTNRNLITTKRLTSSMYQTFKREAPGGSLYQTRGGYAIQIGSYPGSEKQTEASVGRIAADFRSRGRYVKVMKR